MLPVIKVYATDRYSPVVHLNVNCRHLTRRPRSLGVPKEFSGERDDKHPRLYVQVNLKGTEDHKDAVVRPICQECRGFKSTS